jgi:hypothetical protein
MPKATHKLRDGSRTSDRRLARLVRFDDRSLDYPVRDLIDTKGTRTRHWPCAKHLDQANAGACVAFACTHALISRRPSLPGITAKFALEQVYWEAQRADEWDGGAYPSAQPQYEGASVLDTVKVLRARGYFQSFYWAFGLQDLVRALSWVGPAVVGLYWYKDMFDVHGCGYVHASGKRVAGHGILCKGVNVEERYFVLHNSWGASWGHGGDAKISWDDMDQLLHEEGEAVIPIAGRGKPRPKSK